MRTRFWLTVLSPLLASIAYGQQFPSAFPGGGSDAVNPNPQSGVINCSDPSAALQPQCNRNQYPSSPMSPMPGSTGSPQALPGQPGPVTTYNDESPRAAFPESNKAPAPPEALTEFQKFVASSTGQLLPIYGVSLFQNVPSTFAPIDNTPAPADYVLGPGDELRIRIWGQVNFNANVRVDRTGDVFLPQIGAVHVAGLRMNELSQHLHDAIARVYRNFQLVAEVGQIRSIQVYVTGEARRPGVYTVGSLGTLVDALFASGGPSVQGSMRRIELRRGGKTTTTLDLYRFLLDGDKSADVKLDAGDILFIPPTGAQIAVMGSIRRPAIYELLPGEKVASALHDAGGETALASDARASLERSIDRSARQTVEVRLDAAGRETVLQDGDVLHVFSLVSRFLKTVTLRGNTANPGRFAWHEGMRLSDLIPDRNSLVTREYWWKRARMGLTAPEFEPIQGLDELRQPNTPAQLNQASTRLNDDAAHAGTQATTAQSTSSALPLGAALNDRSGSQIAANDANQPNSAAYAGQSALAGQQDQNQLSFTGEHQPRTIVRITAPEVDWSYAVIERMDPVTLKTKLLPFDLGKLLNEHDPSQDLALEPGDVVSIFSQSDIHVPIAEQTTLVHLEGEFVHAGTYSVMPGETLHSLVARAGGITPNAYLYGSVFTRESARILQQRRIDESIHEMTLQMQRGNLALAASPVTTAQDLAGASAAQASQRELLTQLQQIRATGRIVFQFKPDATGIDSVPEMKLENGDTFLIPSIPSAVNVLGAVFNQNSFVYRPGGEVRSFLELAGGPNSNADRKRMFIVRANGAVVSRTVVKSMWTDEFFHLRLYPGDTVIVPEKTIKPSALRGVIDWSQIFSQFAIGAAAINVLR